MKIFTVTGSIILLIGIILLVVGSKSYWNWFKCESTHCGLPVSFDYSYLITGLVIGTTGIVTLVIGLKKRI